MKEGKVSVRDGPQWLEGGVRHESGDSRCDLDVDGGKLVIIDVSGLLEFTSTGEIPE